MVNQKRQAFNPFLPINTYIPDGEPHVFGDRVYLFGSHDKGAGEMYCMLDYEVWSAPITDLTDWSCKGTSFSASQDPLLKDYPAGSVRSQLHGRPVPWLPAHSPQNPVFP